MGELFDRFESIRRKTLRIKSKLEEKDRRVEMKKNQKKEKRKEEIRKKYNVENINLR